jgi:hypothetical protein
MAVPKHKIYADNGSTLIYTIDNVIRRDPAFEIDNPDFVEHTNKRSAGSLIIVGGDAPYDISIYFRLGASNYTTLMTALYAMKTAITKNTHFYLKYDLTLVNDETLESIKVMRLTPIVVDTTRGNLNKFLYGTLTLRANSW